jgi:hypothetical protein
MNFFKARKKVAPTNRKDNYRVVTKNKTIDLKRTKFTITLVDGEEVFTVEQALIPAYYRHSLHDGISGWPYGIIPTNENVAVLREFQASWPDSFPGFNHDFYVFGSGDTITKIRRDRILKITEETTMFESDPVTVDELEIIK